MKHRTIAAGLILGSLLLVSAVAAAPRLSLPEGEFDFGFVPQNSQITHIFWLHSTGEDSLKIIKVNPG